MAKYVFSQTLEYQDCKHPEKPWFCMNQGCETFLGLEKQTNVTCWHFCAPCLQKKHQIVNDSQYRLSRIKKCPLCSHFFCLDCTNFKLRKPNNRFCLSCQPPKKAVLVHEEIPNQEDELEDDNEDEFSDIIRDMELHTMKSSYFGLGEPA